MKRVQPKWEAPNNEGKATLCLYNSLTRKKEPFIPQDGNRVTWYNCGPTVHDTSYFGHAKCSNGSYLSWDILRRVMMDYFKYDIFFCMNITDIEDKIILRARQNHLMQVYIDSKPGLNQVKKDVAEAADLLEEQIAKETDQNKLETLKKNHAAIKELLASGEADIDEIISRSRDVLVPWLDKHKGSEVSDHAIFSQLSQFWEEDFHKDMESLNVLPPDVVTRVSEYVPEVIAYVQKIISNGFGYESNGSVYFDTQAFDASENHFYAKLLPEAFGDKAVLSENGENEKRNATDFALWKAFKPGEPFWNSPWGKGRPGWHIECSAMASEMIGECMDIHSGGISLKFPHHVNEIAQAEAYFGHNQWVCYFLHTGHLSIDAHEMSQSPKKFFTIKEVLNRYTARQVRLLYLLHSWKDALEFSEKTMDTAIEYEKTLSEFFLTAKSYLRNISATGMKAWTKWQAQEIQLNNKFLQKREDVHVALCDNIDTKSALDHIRELVSNTNSYLSSCRSNQTSPNRSLLRSIALYITDLLKVFGVIPKEESIGFPQRSGQSNKLEETVMPYLTSFADFRDKVRTTAREHKDKDILQLCDGVRDVSLPELGVRLEDHEGGPPVIKLMDRETLRKEREVKKRQEEQKRLEKERANQEREQALAAKKAQKKMPPWEMFRGETDKYSAFDDRGIPTHDAHGQELTKSASKKLAKQYEAQEKRYKESLKSIG